MNDFTKKELDEIKRCVKYMIGGGTTPYSSLTMEINKKLHSMIDNYCEHEFSNKSISLHFLMMCEKCNKAFVDDSFPG